MKERVTISIEPEVLEIAQAEVRDTRTASVSAAFEEAMRTRGKRQALRKAIELWEADHGPTGEEAREWARRELDRVFGKRSSSTPER